MTARLRLPQPADVGAEWVFDSSALYHAALADRLDVLGALVPGQSCVSPLAVFDELGAAAGRDRRLAQVRAQPWLAEVRVDGLEDLRNLLVWARLLGAGPHHMGEAAVLTYAQSRAAVAIIDDRRPRKVAKQAGLMAHGTLWLIARACLLGRTLPAAAGGLIDALRGTGARYPCSGAGFPAWARHHGLPLGRDSVEVRPPASGG